MKLRPCIDIHNGKVKQIVGSSLRDEGDRAQENFVSDRGAGYFARLYQSRGLYGGHVIMLNSVSSPEYAATKAECKKALKAYPGGLMAGGGITPENAAEFLDAGASHVIVTSYVFKDGRMDDAALSRMVREVGADRLVLDLSCRRRDDRYLVVTDRWQHFTDQEVTPELFRELSGSCAEFLVHGVDVEGKAAGADDKLLEILTQSVFRPITYAGGVGDMECLKGVRRLTGGRIDITIGSALDIFGGSLPLDEVLSFL